MIADAVAICGYIEELHPDPPLIGATPQERAVVTALNRQIERDGFFAAMDAFRNTATGLKGRALPGPHDYEQIPGACRARAQAPRALLPRHGCAACRAASSSRATATPSRTSATLIVVDFAGRLKLAVPEECANLRRWYAAVSARPSAKV